MNPTIDEIFRTGQVLDADLRPHPHVIATVTRETGVRLYDFVRAHRPARTLEVGMAYGMSTLFMCQAHKDNGGDAVHIAIDPGQESEFKSIGLLNVARAGLEPLLQFYQEPSDRALPRLHAEGRRLDFAFIDGSHLFEFVMLDFYYIDKMLPVGGWLAFDDLWMPSVRKAVSFVVKNRQYRMVAWPSQQRIPLTMSILRVGRRVVQNPFGPDWSLKFVPGNAILLQKAGDDTREWNFHRQF